jgi:FkbM family methyltransferase
MYEYKNPFKIHKMIEEPDPTIPHDEPAAEITEEERILSEEQQKQIEKQKLIDERVMEWNIAEGDRTLRLDYPLNSNSVVFDLGGYIGDWTALIYCMHSPKIHIFEPIPDFYNTIKYRFHNNKNITPYNFGLSSRNEKISIALKDDATDMFSTSDEENIEISVMDIVDFLNKNSIKHIDLLKLNIEGSEYDVLERLIDTGWIDKIDHIQIQFHDFIENSEARRKNIRDHISKTHEEKYNFEFIWESWSKK